MNLTDTTAAQASSPSRRSLRRVLSATLATATVAVAGVATMAPAEASAAGLAPGIRYVSTTTSAASSVNAAALPTQSTKSVRYNVDANGALHAA